MTVVLLEDGRFGSLARWSRPNCNIPIRSPGVEIRPAYPTRNVQSVIFVRSIAGIAMLCSRLSSVGHQVGDGRADDPEAQSIASGSPYHVLGDCATVEFRSRFALR